MVVPDNISRTQVRVNPSDPDSDTIRVYYSHDDEAPPMPSVSVIKGLRVDPEKEEALAGWRERYDGKSSWSRPWWKDQMHFKRYRGTLTHYMILAELGDAAGETYFHQVGDKDWGHEEYDAEYRLKKWSHHAPSANTTEVPYTPRQNKYDGEHAWDRAVRDMKWAARAFKREIIDDGRLDPANVRGVESFVFDTEYGYGGQYDLLYDYAVDDDGNPIEDEDAYDGTPETRTVLSDLKTSSAVRFDHKLQSAAYKRAVESRENITIDECEVIRLHPDSETVEVSRSPDWDRSLEGLANQFLGLADQAWAVEYSDALDRAEQELREETTQSELADTKS